MEITREHSAFWGLEENTQIQKSGNSCSTAPGDLTFSNL